MDRKKIESALAHIAFFQGYANCCLEQWDKGKPISDENEKILRKISIQVKKSLKEMRGSGKKEIKSE